MTFETSRAGAGRGLQVLCCVMSCRPRSWKLLPIMYWVEVITGRWQGATRPPDSQAQIQAAWQIGAGGRGDAGHLERHHQGKMKCPAKTVGRADRRQMSAGCETRSLRTCCRLVGTTHKWLPPALQPYQGVVDSNTIFALRKIAPPGIKMRNQASPAGRRGGQTITIQAEAGVGAVEWIPAFSLSPPKPQ